METRCKDCNGIFDSSWKNPAKQNYFCFECQGRRDRIEARFERLLVAAHIHPIRYETIWSEAEGIETFLEGKRK
jgi:hypothetical protein